MEPFSALLALGAGNSSVTGQFPSQRPVARALMYSLIYAWTNDRVNNRYTGDQRRHRAHYDVTVMWYRIIHTNLKHFHENIVIKFYSKYYPPIATNFMKILFSFYTKIFPANHSHLSNRYHFIKVKCYLLIVAIFVKMLSTNHNPSHLNNDGRTVSDDILRFVLANIYICILNEILHFNSNLTELNS